MTLLDMKEYVKYKTLRRSDDIDLAMFASLVYAAMTRVCMKTMPLSLLTPARTNVLRYDKRGAIRRPEYPNVADIDIDIDNELCYAVAAYVACDIVAPEARSWFKHEAEEIIQDYDRNVSSMMLERKNEEERYRLR